MRLAGGIALANPRVAVTAIMLDAAPELIPQLGLNTVPVVFWNTARRDGPVLEWAMPGLWESSRPPLNG